MKLDMSLELSRKYAKAFNNVFAARLSLSDIEHIAQATDYLESRRRTCFFLRLPVIDDDTKKQALILMCKRFSLPLAVENLIDLLLSHKRSYILPHVLTYIVELYKIRHKILNFTIASSHQLSEKTIETIQEFLAKQTGNTIMYIDKIDKKLIAGLRLESTTFLWEYSIRKHLRRIQQSVRS